ncbi:heme exporter protein CcmD [Tistrella bauzanensis]|uniref:Heme exporter protein D n=1 Tax=Tistrella arctica TaxID=3133430 RepID=A0ABU9YFG9_9PROT
MNDLDTFFAMGGYAAFVWPSFGFALVVLAGLWLHSRAAVRRAEARLARLEALGLGRGRRRRARAGAPSPTAHERHPHEDGAADDVARA